MTTEIQKDYTRLALEQATVKISTNPGGFKGTGFFINPDGYILTAWHCLVPDIICGATITAETIEGQTFTAQLAQNKSVQAWDIAVLKIDYTTEHCVPLGLITENNRGDDVIAIGYPAGYIEGRGIGVYDGIINQLLKPEKTEIDAFETTAIEGQGQSGGLIYHFETNRLIGLAKEIYKDGVTQNTGIAVRFEALLKNKEWPELKSSNQQVAKDWEVHLAKGPKTLEPAQLRELLNQVSVIKGIVAEIEDSDWPFPVYQALQRLSQSPCTLQDYLNVFEAFIHLHFVTLASQFYWAFSQHELTATMDELKAGLAVVYESLVDPNCGGGVTWGQRCAILALACEQLPGQFPLN